jgi:high-affinity nickel-transport protein
MNFAYSWAFSKAIRKIYYNMVITALSVAVALVIGSIELISVLIDHVDIEFGPLAVIGRLDLSYVGYGIVGLFIVTWLAAVMAWRVARIEQKWTRNIRGQRATAIE